MIIGKLIPAGTGHARGTATCQVKIKPEAIPEYWLARQREIARGRRRVETGEPALVGLTREQAERMLGGGLSAGKADDE